MKKFSIMLSLLSLLIISFVEANNGYIEHIGNDIILTYNSQSIILHDSTIDGNTQKCPVGYHIGTAEEWSNIMRTWYNIKGNDFEYMSIKLDSNNNYSINERYEKNRDQCMREHNYEAGSCNDYPDFETDFGLYKTFKKDLAIGSENPDNSVRYYKTSTYGSNHYPYIFTFLGTSSFGGISTHGHEGSVSLKVCSNITNVKNPCTSITKVRCFKDDKNTTITNGYSKEYNDAYIFAYNNKITTMPSIEEANMNGEIIRAEIAKMLANWVKAFGYYADPNASCKFTDTSSVKGDLATAIIESCQYGIMGQGITQFRPYDKITKAEVATAISRILWGSQYDGGVPFYINHVYALENAGVLSDSSTINANELRGNVMLMLMKANSILKSNSTDCEDPYIKAQCSNSGNEYCPEKCKNN